MINLTGFPFIKLPLASLALATALLLASCVQEVDNGGSNAQAVEPIPIPLTQKFYAYDFYNGSNYQITADRLAVGEKCIVWAEKSANISVAIGKAVAQEYDDKIYPGIVGAFGSDDIMDDGDVDGNGKFTLLLLDIRDGFTVSGSYVAGYFGASDLFKGANSNRADMLYVDTYPSSPNSWQSYATIAHELQHFINYMTTYTNKVRTKDTWIDEGLSTAAEYIYLGEHDTDRVNIFTNSQSIAQGNTFFVWGENQAAVLDEYSSVYLFFQWLRLQSGGTAIYRQIIESPQYDYRAVTGAITGAFATALGSTNWEKLLQAWFAANYINSSTGIYGYKGELSTVRIRAIEGQSKPLLPGEGVYSLINSKTPFAPADNSSGPHIKYAGLTKSGNAAPVDDVQYTGERLLTFNSSTLQNGAREEGLLAGSAIPEASIVDVENDRQAGQQPGQQPWQRPDSWVIDARDVLGRREPEKAGGILLRKPGNGDR